MRISRPEPSRLIVGALTIGAVIVLWYVLTTLTHVIPPVFLPTPAE